MEAILGLVMIYSWIHLVVIIYKNFKNFSLYEKIVTNISLLTMVLFVIGSIS